MSQLSTQPAGSTEPAPRPSEPVRASNEIALVDLLDRLLAGGVVLTGDLTISLAGVDLVRVSLRAIISSIREGDTDLRDWEPDSHA
ncbi:gas vesicle protein GvpA/GvpJ/GvpM family [Saccharopolyspora erythraea NRRL 2338]|uniref:Gas vesicle synthesis protein n=2 Tax=Saccharopolyspora erythraea TaxID=1836 RepID=A4F8C5_SACEN|nr:gas vesicle protein [Saccharopolyspora erythraea]EQD85350.1 gas vesicle protein [Saccharopolyspora erythraea D]PFG94095.1 gas vesicle protein GvpA/GvpJ/GvpM family [Saccharopolyspora erythraea NRRL 2338]CAM00300.1 gas vesicle synthesis protein [Saccharopolyspora erythraea NRRL 2338]